MRNLKRVLSLTLASVMLLGMMVIGSSAAQDYSDVDYDNDNIEAIEVLDAINVMRGDLDANGELAGTFRPGSDVKRSEMARIMAFLMDLDYDYYVGVNPFSDMVGHWAEKFAAACAANGIIYGRGDGIYDPDATVTAVEAASMLMRALGYFQNPEVDQPNGFEIDTIRQAGRINLFNKVDAKTNEPMTRNDVAQLVLNALQSGMVEPSTNSKIDVTVGDAQVSIGNSNYVYTVARDNTVGKAINATTAEAGNSSTGLEGWILDLGEHLYQGELRLNSDAQDVFGRPARTWEFKGQTIGTYYKTELLMNEGYTTSVTGKTLYDLLGSSIVEGSNQYDFRIYMDGLDHDANDYIFEKVDINRNNNSNLNGTGRGVLTQVFVDNNKENIYDRGEVTITMINTYLAIATADYNEKRDQATLDVYYLTRNTSRDLIRSESLSDARDNEEIVPLTITSDDIPAAADVLEDEVYLVTVAEGEIQSLVPARALEETAIQAFDTDSYVEVDGHKYNFARTLLYDIDTLRNYTGDGTTNLKEAVYNVFLDPYDNAIGVERIDPAKNYVFITGVDSNYSFLAVTNYKVNGIFLDGTMATITVDSRKSDVFTDYITADPGIAGDDAQAVVNCWCTYTVNSAGVYTVVPVDGAPNARTGSDANMSKRAQYHDDPDLTNNELIDNRNYSLVGDNGGIYSRVYANDATVFLTASVKQVQTEENKWDVLIDDVDGVAVGIDNVKIDVFDENTALTRAEDYNVLHADQRHTSYGSYILYNDKGYIIAAVVVGDDGGVGSDYVYVHSGNGDIEERDLGDDLWQWTRKAIVKGEETTLTEINDSGISYLEDMDRYKWYRVTYKADGTVKSATSFISTDTSVTGSLQNNGGIGNWGTGLPSGHAATTDVTHIEDLIKTNVGVGYTGTGRDVVVYHQNITNAKPTLDDNRTLHVLGGGYTNTDGIRVAEDVKVWFSQIVKNNRSWSNGERPSYLKSVINDLRETSSGTYNYDIAALIENGIATTVIIYDEPTDYTRPTGSDDKIIGTPVSANFNIEDINALLVDGDVTVMGNWQPDTSTPHATQLVIPGGRTLKFMSDVNLTKTSYYTDDAQSQQVKTSSTNGGNQITVATVGTGTHTMIVNGRLFTDDKVASTIDFDIEAKAITFATGSITIDSSVTITGNGNNDTVRGADMRLGSSVTVTLNKDRNLTVSDKNAPAGKKAYVSGGSGASFVVNGHAVVNGVIRTNTNVNSWNTLIASEPVEATVTIGNIGNEIGRFEGKMATGQVYTYDFDSTLTTTPTITLPAFEEGAIIIVSEPMTINSVPKDATLIVGEGVDVTIGSIATKNIVLGPNSSIDITGSVTGDAVGVIVTPSGGVINGSVGSDGVSIKNESPSDAAATTQAAANAVATAKDKGFSGSVGAESATASESGTIKTEEEPTGGNVTPAVTVTATIVYDKTTWNAAVNAGYVPVQRNSEHEVPKWDEFWADEDPGVQWDSKNAPKTFPWLLVKVTNNVKLDIDADAKYTVSVTKGNSTLWEAAAWEEDSIPTLANKSLTMHWDMFTDRHDEDKSTEDTDKNLPDDHDYVLSQATTGDSAGVYKVTVSWTDTDEVTHEAEVATTASFAYSSVKSIIEGLGG